MTISTEPMASGAIAPAYPIPAAHPIVKIRKKVPINSVTYLFILEFPFIKQSNGGKKISPAEKCAAMKWLAEFLDMRQFFFNSRDLTSPVFPEKARDSLSPG